VDPDSDKLAERLATMIDESQAALGGEDALLSSAPTPAVRVRGEFGGAVQFLGADAPAGGRAGADLDITWYFECKKRLSGAWKPFVHVEGPNRFLGDHDPANGALPISRWKPGQIIADRQKLHVPPGTPPGDYVVYLGIFQGDSRLPLAGAGGADAGENRLRVTTIRVTP
jgi:hypothetical protein